MTEFNDIDTMFTNLQSELSGYASTDDPDDKFFLVMKVRNYGCVKSRLILILDVRVVDERIALSVARAES
jgi:hypothetical protein